MSNRATRMRRGRQPSGLGMVEALVAISILGFVILGLIAGATVASGGNAFSRRRSLMLQFAQSRMELLVAMTRTNIPTSSTTSPVNCSAMAVSGTFNPNAAPGTGGWMLDVIDGQPPDGTTAVGDDLMAGPLVAEGDLEGVNRANTLSTRTALATSWFSGTDTAGCGSTAVTSNPAVFCREIHIEPYDYTAGTVAVNMLRVWVRVVRGGTTNWQNSSITLQEDIAQ